MGQDDVGMACRGSNLLSARREHGINGVVLESVCVDGYVVLYSLGFPECLALTARGLVIDGTDVVEQGVCIYERVGGESM